MALFFRSKTRSATLFGVFLFAVSSCSEIPENEDPVIGIWAKTYSIDNQTFREEWIFNDVYLGRYQQYHNQVLKLKSDFAWEVHQSVYTISYPGLDRVAEQVYIKQDAETLRLETSSGDILAERE